MVDFRAAQLEDAFGFGFEPSADALAFPLGDATLEVEATELMLACWVSPADLDPNYQLDMSLR